MFNACTTFCVDSKFGLSFTFIIFNLISRTEWFSISNSLPIISQQEMIHKMMLINVVNAQKNGCFVQAYAKKLDGALSIARKKL
ncbi:unnamed protein product [Trifolium pratense]|uniref:Uncharacterized protein n=1 Tax=Trifolium pratense TaxID=57577 RepID=A0ACB0J6N2_TRIPR|nr:unnamed protein product [Trifolium pratense]